MDDSPIWLKHSRSRSRSDTRSSSESSDRFSFSIGQQLPDSVPSPVVKRLYTSDVEEESEYTSASEGSWYPYDTRSLSGVSYQSASPIARQSVDPDESVYLTASEGSWDPCDTQSLSGVSYQSASPITRRLLDPDESVYLTASEGSWNPSDTQSLSGVSYQSASPITRRSPDPDELLSLTSYEDTPSPPGSPDRSRLSRERSRSPTVQKSHVQAFLPTSRLSSTSAAVEDESSDVSVSPSDLTLSSDESGTRANRNLKTFGLDCIEVGKPYIQTDDTNYAIECHDDKAYTPYILYSCRGISIKVDIKILLSYADNDWDIGLIQALAQHSFMSFDTELGEITDEIHPISQGYYSMMSDGESGKFWPFYSYDEGKNIGESHIRIRKGVVQPKAVTLVLQDYPSQSESVDLKLFQEAIPIRGGVDFRQFFVWIAALKRGHFRRKENEYDERRFQIDYDEIYTAYTVCWQNAGIFEVDFEKPVHSEDRIKLTEDLGNDPPLILDKNIDIPLSAVIPPVCNSGIHRFFRPNNQALQELNLDAMDPLMQYGHFLVLLLKPLNIIVPWLQFLTEISEGYEIRDDFSQHPTDARIDNIPAEEDCINVMEFLPDIQPELRRWNQRSHHRPEGTEVERAVDKVINRFARKEPYCLGHLRMNDYKRMLLDNQKEFKEAMAQIPSRMYETTEDEKKPKKVDWTPNSFEEF